MDDERVGPLEKEGADPPLAETGMDDVEAVSLAGVLGLGQGRRLRNFQPKALAK